MTVWIWPYGWKQENPCRWSDSLGGGAPPFMDEKSEVQRTVGIIKARDSGSLSLVPGSSPTFVTGYGGMRFLKAAYITLLSAWQIGSARSMEHGDPLTHQIWISFLWLLLLIFHWFFRFSFLISITWTLSLLPMKTLIFFLKKEDLRR